jgi:hypothetical protein
MATPPVDYATLAKKFGGTTVKKGSVDYAALAKKFGGTTTPAKTAAPAVADFTANPKGEGTYTMMGKDKKSLGIPYSQVRAAHQAGYRMTDPGTIKKYLADTAADPNAGRGENLPPGVRVAGRNTSGKAIYAPVEAAGPQGGALGRFVSSAGNAIGGAVSGIYHGVVEGPQNPEEAATKEKVGKAGLVAKRMLYDPYEQEVQAGGRELTAAEKAKTPHQMAAHGMKAAGHTIAAALPGVGPWAAQVGAQVGTQIGTGDIAGAAGTAAGNVAVYEAPKIAKGVAGAGVEGVRGVGNMLTDTGPRGLKEMAKQTVEANKTAAEKVAADNKAAADKHLLETKKALHKTKGSALIHDEEVKRAKAAADDANAKLKQAHAEKVKTIEAANDAKKAEYEAAKSKAAEVKKAAEQLETRRGQLARQVQEQSARLLDRIRRIKADWKDDSQYIRNENARVKKARAAGEEAEYQPHGKLDVAYDQIRKATAGKTVAPKLLADAVTKAEGKLKGSSESIKIFRDILSKAEDADENPDVIKTRTEGDVPKGHPLYQILLDMQREEKGGETAPPADFSQLRGYYSELGEKLAGGNLPGDVYQALRSLQDDIGGMAQKMANESGVGTKFSQTQGLYRQYMETFREAAGPNHSGSPIAQALDAADPAYAIKPLMAEETAQRVRNMLTTFDPPTEGQGGAGKLFDSFRQTTREFEGLGKPINVPEAPKPPKLEEPPVAPQPVQPKEVAPSISVTPPDRPLEIKAEPKTLSAEDIVANRKANIAKLDKELRTQGVRRTINSLYYTAPAAVMAKILGKTGYALVELALSPVILVGSHVLANLLEREGVVNWLSKVTERDLSMVHDHMPPEMQAAFAKNLGALAKTATKKGLTVSKGLKAFLGGNAVASGQNLQQLREKAQKLQQQQEAATSAKEDVQETADQLQEVADQLQQETMTPETQQSVQQLQQYAQQLQNGSIQPTADALQQMQQYAEQAQQAAEDAQEQQDTQNEY